MEAPIGLVEAPVEKVSIGEANKEEEEEKMTLEEKIAWLHRRPDDLEIFSQYGLTIRVKDVKTILTSGWLGTDAIEMLIRMTAKESGVRSLVFDTYLKSRLRTDKAIDLEVQRTLKRNHRPTPSTILLFPVHIEGNHWILIQGVIHESTLYYMDPLGNYNAEVAEPFAKFCMKLGNMRSKPRVVKETRATLQLNNYDCAIFTIRYAQSILLGKPFSFPRSHIPELREEWGEKFLDSHPGGLERVDSQSNPSPHVYDPVYVAKLRDKKIPFLDRSYHGKPITYKAGGDWTQMRRLQEVLSSLDSSTAVAWDKLDKLIQENPYVIADWIESRAPIGEPQSPYDFVFGTTINLLKVNKLFKRYHPNLPINNKVTTHPGRRERNKRKELKYLADQASKGAD